MPSPTERSAQPENAAVDPGQLLGRIVNGKYEVLSILGEGGMGVVYKVRHLILPSKNAFAMKVLHPMLCAQVDIRARFLREVEIAMELTHENIIQIRDFGVTEQDLLFYTMDFFAGDSLKAVIETQKAMAAERVVSIMKQVLLALCEAHGAGIIHRDLKPDNLLVERMDDGTDRVRVLDFGIAKILTGDGQEERENLTQENILGTPKYMSPEQASGEPIDARSDLYSLGCILFEMLTGSVPFKGNTARNVLMAHLTAPVPRLREVLDELVVPDHLERLVYRLLEKDRTARPPSAEAVLELLTGQKTSVQPNPGGSTTGWTTRFGRPPAKKRAPRTLILALAGAGVLALAATGFFLFPPGASSAAGRRSVPPAGEGPAPAVSPADWPPAGAERLRCAVCGAIYAFGEKVGDMCHGEPLIGDRE